MSDSDAAISRALARLGDLGGPGFLRQMIGLFLEQAHQKIGLALAAQRAGDVAGIGKAVHPLRSSAGNVGACVMQELAARIEQLAGERKADEIHPLLRELEEAFARVKPRLEQERDLISP